ncbi:hypothetical protein D3C80_1264970 [compost metagenome]
MLDAAADHDVPRQAFVGVDGRVGAQVGAIQGRAFDVAGGEARAQLHPGVETVALDRVPAQAVQPVGIDHVAIGGRAPGGEVELIALAARGAETAHHAAADVDLPRLGRLDRLIRLGLGQGGGGGQSDEGGRGQRKGQGGETADGA